MNLDLKQMRENGPSNFTLGPRYKRNVAPIETTRLLASSLVFCLFGKPNILWGMHVNNGENRFCSRTQIRSGTTLKFCVKLRFRP